LAEYDVVVLGSGPGGYVAAIRAGQLGMKTAVVERDALGGICLNWGCIPSKALLRNAEVLNLIQHSEEYGISIQGFKADFSRAIDRSRQVVDRLTRGVATLLRRNGVEHVSGTGVLSDANTVVVDGDKALTADNVIIATGARQRHIQGLPIDGETVITSREALELRRVPARAIIIGGGATGCEFAYMWRAYGADVTIVELLPRLVPNGDEEVSSQLERSFRRQGIQIATGAQVQGIAVDGGTAKVSILSQGESSVLEGDAVLVAVGVEGNVDGIGLEAVGVEVDRGFIPVDDMMKTNVEGIYAIGDVTGKLLLAHVASAQGVTAIEHIAGLNPQPLDYDQIPSAIYCRPQVASFGMTEAQAREEGHSIKIGKFPLAASGKALALNESEGMIKLVVDAEIGEVLGAHMIGAEVTELLGELAMTRLLEATTAELGWLVHPHPTISEALKEAALAAEGEAIHI
jgi:dihydrolipoamide dehydrogenase